MLNIEKLPLQRKGWQREGGKLVGAFAPAFKAKVNNIVLNESITLDEIKKALRVDHNFDDDLIQTTINAAIEIAEEYTRFSINKREIEILIYKANGRFKIPWRPLLEIPSILDQNGNALSNEDYYIYENEIIFLKEFKEVNLRYIAGGSKIIPNTLKAAIIMHVCQMYENTEFKFDGNLRYLYNTFREIRL